MAAALVGVCALVGCAKDKGVSGTDVTGNADISGSQAAGAADESKAEQTDGAAGAMGTRGRILRIQELMELTIMQQVRTMLLLH